MKPSQEQSQGGMLITVKLYELESPFRMSATLIGQIKLRLALTRIMGGKKSREKDRKSSLSKAHQILTHLLGQCVRLWAGMAAKRIASLVFIYNVTAGRSSRMNFEMTLSDLINCSAKR